MAGHDRSLFMKASPLSISITHDPWKLYIADPQYGSFGYERHGSWEMVQGSYVRALFFEYMATLGMLDVAYVPPEASPVDMGGQWGTDDLACLKPLWRTSVHARDWARRLVS